MLVYATDNFPGFKRRKYGKGFIYLDEQGKRINDIKCLERIKNLGIPPMWKDVWISKNSKAHLQCTGRDAKNRKQYLYHEEWGRFSQETKFKNLLIFAKHLPEIRIKIESDLRHRQWDKQRVLALAVKLMDEMYLRIGNEYYRQQNETYGLTTLRRKHLRQLNGRMSLQYKAKSGKLRTVNIETPRLKKLIQQCSELPGYEIFKYKEGNEYHQIDSGDVNAYLRELTGEEISAKYFRTWGGTVLSIQLAAEANKIIEENPRKKADTSLIRLVAARLGNTVSVCRSYYMHPAVFEHVLSKKPVETKKLPKGFKHKEWYSEEEIGVINILTAKKIIGTPVLST